MQFIYGLLTVVLMVSFSAYVGGVTSAITVFAVSLGLIAILLLIGDEVFRAVDELVNPPFEYDNAPENLLQQIEALQSNHSLTEADTFFKERANQLYKEGKYKELEELYKELEFFIHAFDALAKPYEFRETHYGQLVDLTKKEYSDLFNKYKQLI